MPDLTRRGFIAAAVAAGTARSLPNAAGPNLAASSGGRRILTLVYDKSLGMMRAVERILP